MRRFPKLAFSWCTVVGLGCIHVGSVEVKEAAGPAAAGVAAASPTAASPTAARHSEDLRGPVEIVTPPLRRILEFHGHVGPYVVLGYRMGQTAMRVLESPGYFDMTAAVESPLQPPASCLIDGVQLGSGATTGKRNLTVSEGAIARGTFVTKPGKIAVIALRPELPEKIQGWIDAEGLEATGRRLLEAPEGEIFAVERK